MSSGKYPPGLRAAGRRAFDRAIAGLTDPEREAFGDLIERFARQVDTAEDLRREWVRLKRPTLAAGSTGQVTAHPLIATMRQADLAVRALARELRLTPSAVAVGQKGRAGDRTPDKRLPEPGAPAAGGLEPQRIRRVK